MLKAVNPKARYCYERACEARERALQASNPLVRDDFFAAEKRWLRLAESYEFSGRLSHYLAQWPQSPMHPVCPACSVRMWLLEMNVGQSGVDYRYECKACGRTALVSESQHSDH